MAATYRQQVLRLLRRSDRELAGFFRDLADAARGELLRAAGPDGVIPRSRSSAVRESVWGTVTRRFLVSTRSGDLAPFEVVGGEVQTVTPFMRVLWGGVTEATRQGVQRHADLMERRLAKAPALVARLRLARRDPFAQAQPVRQQLVWQPRPFARYDPAHTWVDPRGYQLSDRIWQTTITLRRRIDLLIDEGIREGRSAVDIARDLEVFLQPGRRLLRTDRPYGQDGSADALRLARTEITRAHAQADLMAAQLNPFVEQFDWVLSGSHPRADICDELAAGSPYDKGDDAQIPPAHPHCLCYLRWHTVEDAQAVIDELKAEAARQRSLLLELVGPLLVEEFTRLLLRDAEFIFPPAPVPFP
jgi:hypothetical protein